MLHAFRDVLHFHLRRAKRWRIWMFYLLWRRGVGVFICRFGARTKWKDCWLLYVFSDLWSVTSSVSSMTASVCVRGSFRFHICSCAFPPLLKSCRENTGRLSEQNVCAVWKGDLKLWSSTHLKCANTKAFKHAYRQLPLRVIVRERYEHIYRMFIFLKKHNMKRQRWFVCRGGSIRNMWVSTCESGLTEFWSREDRIISTFNIQWLKRRVRSFSSSQ